MGHRTMFKTINFTVPEPWYKDRDDSLGTLAQLV
jgi:hypothetical protein